MRKCFRCFVKTNNLLVVYLVILLLTACNDDDTDTIRHDGNNLEINLALPGPLAEPIDGLQAYVTLNDGSRTPLTVNATDNTTNGRIDNVAVGTYQLTLVYFKEIASIEVTLAEFTKTITVSKGQTTSVTIADDELDRNFDYDGDGYTNLAEVRIGISGGGDPLDKFTSPGSPPRFAVGHGSYGEGDTAADGYYISSITGESLGGSTTSTNFQFKAGFTSY